MISYTDYIILKNKISFDNLQEYYSLIDEMSFDEIMIVGQLFGNIEDDINICFSNKVDKIDIFHLDDPDKINLKNKIKKAFKDAINKILLPLVNWDFSEPTPNLGDYFIIKIDENKAALGVHKNSYYRGDWRSDKVIVHFMLIKRFVLK